MAVSAQYPQAWTIACVPASPHGWFDVKVFEEDGREHCKWTGFRAANLHVIAKFLEDHLAHLRRIGFMS